MSTQKTLSNDQFTKGRTGFAIYHDNVYAITAVMINNGFIYAHFGRPLFGHATLKAEDCFFSESDARACLNARNKQLVEKYKAEISDMYSLLNFALHHTLAGNDVDEQARQAFMEKAAALGYSMTKAKPAQPAVNDYPSDICATCGNRAKTPGCIGPNCLACKHSYFEGSEAYEYKRDYYVPETEENNQ